MHAMISAPARQCCWRCGTIAVVVLTTSDRGNLAYCSDHFLRLGQIPAGSAARWVHDPTPRTP